MPYLGIFDQKCLIWEIFGLELKKKNVLFEISVLEFVLLQILVQK